MLEASLQKIVAALFVGGLIGLADATPVPTTTRPPAFVTCFCGWYRGKSFGPCCPLPERADSTTSIAPTTVLVSGSPDVIATTSSTLQQETDVVSTDGDWLRRLEGAGGTLTFILLIALVAFVIYLCSRPSKTAYDPLLVGLEPQIEQTPLP